MPASSVKMTHLKTKSAAAAPTASRLWQVLWTFRIAQQASIAHTPYRLWIEPTALCNLHCPHCPNSVLIGQGHLGYMEFDLYRKIIDEAGQWVHDVNLMHRGEALLHPGFFEMVSYAEQRGIFTKLHTNASLLNKENAIKVLASGLALISFSFDGLDQETYELHRAGGDFEHTLGNILQFLRLKREHRRQSPVTVLEIIKFPGEDPLKGEKQRAVLAQLKEQGLDHLIVKQPHNWAGSRQITAGGGGLRLTPCTFPWHALVVQWDGKVGPCPHDFFGKICLGDVRESSLAEIFHGPEAVSLREKMLQHRFEELEPCATCDSLRRKTILGIPRDSLGFLRW